jgi:CRP/FNR family transcriptional regulator, cyclic AMP receptor protein
MSRGIPDALMPGPGRRRRAARQPEVALTRTRHETAAVLGMIPLFAQLSKRHLQRLARDSDELDFEPGQRIVEEGMLGEAMFVVLAGQGKVMRGGRRVGKVVPGDFFGELSVLDGGPRSATIAAETPMRVLRLFRHTLLEMLKEEPALSLKLLDGIVRRIREIQRGSD